MRIIRIKNKYEFNSRRNYLRKILYIKDTIYWESEGWSPKIHAVLPTFLSVFVETNRVFYHSMTPCTGKKRVVFLRRQFLKASPFGYTGKREPVTFCICLCVACAIPRCSNKKTCRRIFYEANLYVGKLNMMLPFFYHGNFTTNSPTLPKK